MVSFLPVVAAMLAFSGWTLAAPTPAEDLPPYESPTPIEDLPPYQSPTPTEDLPPFESPTAIRRYRFITYPDLKDDVNNPLYQAVLRSDFRGSGEFLAYTNDKQSYAPYAFVQVKEDEGLGFYKTLYDDTLRRCLTDDSGLEGGLGIYFIDAATNACPKWHWNENCFSGPECYVNIRAPASDSEQDLFDWTVNGPQDSTRNDGYRLHHCGSPELGCYGPRVQIFAVRMSTT